MHVDDDVARELAPNGAIRAAINFGNPVLAQRDPASGEPRGVSVAIARELARRTGLGVTFVPFDAAGKVFAALTEHAFDVAFLAIDPQRATRIDFTQPYVIIEGSYMVRVDSPLRAIEEFDRPGIRIAVATDSAYDLYLTRTIARARLVRAPTGDDALALFLRDGLEAVAGVKSPLERYAFEHGDFRVIDGRFMTIEQAMALPKGTQHARSYLEEMLRDLKQSGFVLRALEATGQTDARVAPV
jgi:polar amino acid transport system substrate-binding protein